MRGQCAGRPVNRSIIVKFQSEFRSAHLATNLFKYLFTSDAIQEDQAAIAARAKIETTSVNRDKPCVR